jgi:hypothetical protein
MEIRSSDSADWLRLKRIRVRALADSPWVDPLNDRVRSAIMGYDHSALSDLASRTLRLAIAE